MKELLSFSSDLFCTLCPVLVHMCTTSIRSYSWSANICGVKEWLLYRPGQEAMLKDKWGHLPSDVTSLSLRDVHTYPAASSAATPLRVIQRAGQVLFVPRQVQTHTLTHTHTHTLSLSLSHTHSLVNILSHIHFLSHTQRYHKHQTEIKLKDGSVVSKLR